MKLRVGIDEIKHVGLNAAIVLSVLAMRARKASLFDGSKRFFFCPVARNDGEVIDDRSYRPLTDVLSFMGEQTIRDCNKDLETGGYLEVLRKGNRWARVHLPSGKVQKKRTHRYHIPDDVLAEHEENVRSERSYVVLETEKAAQYGALGAIVLNLFEFQAAKQRKKSFASDVVSLTVPELARKVGVSEGRVRRALKVLVMMGALDRLGSFTYQLITPSAITIRDCYRVPTVAPVVSDPVVCEQNAQSDLVGEWALPSAVTFVPTGIAQLDRNINAFGKGELAFLVGQTGHGKTITMLNFAIGAALAGFKPLILSLEMSLGDLAARLYSNLFQVECNKIRNGTVDREAQFKLLPERLRSLLGVIKIVDARGKMTTAELADTVRKHKEEGYYPDVILIDQFSYLLPNVKLSDDVSDWRNQKNVASDLAAWGKSSLETDHPFAIWCLNQANGDVALEYDRGAISGCKAIIEPASLVVGIGHNDVEPKKLRMFSLKTRHGKPFELTLSCDFSRMTVGDCQVVEDLLILAS